MGTLRVVLALIVLLFHCPEGIIPRFLHPALAVQCFYCISGFYIQLLIKQFQKNQINWKFNFYKSRAIRIYPTYALFVMGILLFFPQEIRINSPENSTISNYFLFIFDNLFIISQDIMIFAHRFFTILPVSWTLSIEMMFYIVAPFILTKNTKWVILIITSSIFCRTVLSHYGYNDGKWQYTFFPNEISIFLLGSVSYRFYERYLQNSKYYASVLYELTGFFALVYIIHLYFNGCNYVSSSSLQIWGVSFRWWCLLLVTAISLPFIFKFSKSSKIDRYIGELSYPVYLGHFFVLYLVRGHIQKQCQSLAVIIVTLIISIIIMHIIEIPLSKLRQSYKSPKQPDDNILYAGGNGVLPSPSQT